MEKPRQDQNIPPLDDRKFWWVSIVALDFFGSIDILLL